MENLIRENWVYFDSIQKSAKFFKYMVERCGIAMIITDHNLDILFSNSHFQDIIQKTQHFNIKKKKQYNLLNFLDPISQTSIKQFTTQREHTM